MPSINQAGRETERMVLPDDAEFVEFENAHEHGYYGVTPDTTDRDEYTFAGAAKRLQQRTEDNQSSRSETSTRSTARSSTSSTSKSAAKDD